jgi:hypothetical protein
MHSKYFLLHREYLVSYDIFHKKSLAISIFSELVARLTLKYLNLIRLFLPPYRDGLDPGVTPSASFPRKAAVFRRGRQSLKSLPPDPSRDIVFAATGRQVDFALGVCSAGPACTVQAAARSGEAASGRPPPPGRAAMLQARLAKTVVGHRLPRRVVPLARLRRREHAGLFRVS